jgi:membrane protease YdiL (CAAX protease family)
MDRKPRILRAAVLGVLLDAAIFAGLAGPLITLLGTNAGLAVNYALRALSASIVLVFGTRGIPASECGITVENFRSDAVWTAKLIAALVGIAAVLMAAGVFVIRLAKVRVDLGNDLDLWPVSLLCAPLAEELVYRCLLVPGLKEAYGPRTVVAFSGLLFYALHLGYQRPWWHVHYFVGGALLGWVFLQRPRLWIVVLLHTGGNLLVMADDVLWKISPDAYLKLLGQPH